MWPPMENSARPCSSILIQRFVHNPRRLRLANIFPTVESYLPVWRDCQTSQSGREIRSAHMTAPPTVPGTQLARTPHSPGSLTQTQTPPACPPAHSFPSRRGKRPDRSIAPAGVASPSSSLESSVGGRDATTHMDALLVSLLPVLVGASEIRGPGLAGWGAHSATLGRTPRPACLCG